MIATFPAKCINIDEYPAVQEWLDSFHPKLNQTGEPFINSEGKPDKSRKKTNNKWFETQDQISYWKEFEKDKIIWAEIVYNSAFVLDTKCTHIEATAFILTGEKLAYLTAILNSKPATYFFKNFYSGGDLRGNTFRYKKAFLNNLPIPIPNKQHEVAFEVLVGYIQYLYKDTEPINEYVPNSHIAEVFEEVIDAMVFELYFPEEFKKVDIQFVKYIERDFQSIDGKSENNQKEIIHNTYQKLREKENEIRNNLQLMDIRLENLVMQIKSI